MSYITDLYKFTREVDKQTKENDELPKINQFNTHYANTYLKGNKRYANKISEGALSEKYDLVCKEYDRYSMTLKGYNIVKGIPFFRPGLINLWIVEYDKSLGTASKFLLSGIFWGLILGLYKIIF